MNGLLPNSLNGVVNLTTDNPNSAQSQRLTPSEALTCDQNPGYTPEQMAFDSGKIDKFVQYTGSSPACSLGSQDFSSPGLVMNYYDG